MELVELILRRSQEAEINFEPSIDCIHYTKLVSGVCNPYMVSYQTSAMMGPPRL